MKHSNSVRYTGFREVGVIVSRVSPQISLAYNHMHEAREISHVYEANEWMKLKTLAQTIGRE